jgi:aryl-alcohol dehydrogenase-like predicted oxidoreductase
MASLQEEGSIRFCGVSNFTVEQLRRAQKIVPIVSNQINYNALNRSPERGMLEYCAQHHISVISHSSLAKGILSGSYGAGHRFAPGDERSTFPGYSGELFGKYLAVAHALKQAAEAEGFKPVQAAIIWLLVQEEITSVLVGPKTVSQLEDSVAALTVRAPALRPALRERMNAILDSSDLPPLCPFPNQLV